MKSLRSWFAPAPDSRLADAMRRGKSPRAEFIHLLWSAWVFITPAFGMGYDLRWLLLTIASFPLFLFLYTKTLVAPYRHAFRYPLAMIALCMALLPWYPSGLSYFVFGCVMLAPARSRRFGLLHYLAGVLVLGAAVVAEALWIGYPWQSVVWLPPMTMVIAVIVGVEQRDRENEAALRLSHDEVRRLAATAERERIGRDLHDLLGHTLSLVALKSELASRLCERDAAAARREIDEVQRIARDALSQVRHAVTGIRAAGIAAELASARLLLESEGVGLGYDGLDVALPVDTETVLALVIREAVTNVHRHARAAKVRIELHVDGNAVRLQIADDGRGAQLVPGTGLNGMRERVEAAGGSLRIDSARGSGTRIEACLPLPASSADIVALPPRMQA